MGKIKVCVSTRTAGRSARLGGVIVVVEGPSGAGKTTWVRRVAPHAVVPEHGALDPPSGEDDAVARTWAARNAERWGAARRLEASAGVAVCDTDPLKLHYDFCLARLGEASMDRVRAGARACRAAIVGQELGIADVVVCGDPGDEELAQRVAGDATRTRRRFELHRRLGPPLREWYAALQRLDPGRVIWGFPEELPVVSPRGRYDTGLFDAWMAELGVQGDPRR
jgi:hypothetical protein